MGSFSVQVLRKKGLIFNSAMKRYKKAVFLTVQSYIEAHKMQLRTI